jgi:hypothetical protein
MQTCEYALLGCDAVYIGRQTGTFSSTGYKSQHISDILSLLITGQILRRV